ncbi:UNVERIFIED_CONTAM: hypothetical protein FKN15_047080 [Acipenser sinensis]
MCKVVGEAVTSSIQDPKDWKQDFGKELLQEVKGQLVDCMREMWAEISGMRGPPPAGNPSVREHPVRGPPLHQGSTVRWSNCPMPSPNQWDDQGRPICRRCGESGKKMSTAGMVQPRPEDKPTDGRGYCG